MKYMNDTKIQIMNVQYLFIYSIKYNYFSTKKKKYSIHCSIKNFVNQCISIFLIIANIITYSATPFTIHEYRRLYPRFSEPMRRNTPNEVYPTLVDTQVSDGNCNVDTHIYIYTRRNMRNYFEEPRSTWPSLTCATHDTHHCNSTRLQSKVLVECFVLSAAPNSFTTPTTRRACDRFPVQRLSNQIGTYTTHLPTTTACSNSDLYSVPESPHIRVFQHHTANAKRAAFDRDHSLQIARRKRNVQQL